MSDLPWIHTKASVSAIHELQLSEFGGAEGTLNSDFLFCVDSYPKTKHCYYTTFSIFQLSAAYAFNFIKTHPYLDGNKRTALMLSETFLKRNNYYLTASQEEKYKAIISLASGEWTEDQLAEWFENNTQKVSE